MSTILGCFSQISYESARFFCFCQLFFYISEYYCQPASGRAKSTAEKLMKIISKKFAYVIFFSYLCSAEQSRTKMRDYLFKVVTKYRCIDALIVATSREIAYARLRLRFPNAKITPLYEYENI